jgi:hypothetical protein
MIPKALIVSGVGNRPPTSSIPWRVDFEQIAGGTYIGRECALQPVDFGKKALLRDMCISFQDVKLEEAFPFTNTIGMSTPVDQLRDP